MLFKLLSRNSPGAETGITVKRLQIAAVAVLTLGVTFGIRMFSNPRTTPVAVPSASSTVTAEIDYDQAVFVAPAQSERDQSQELGTLDNPYDTVSAATAAAEPYSTVVLRAGTYHEQLLLADKYLSIVGYPGENIVFDGAEELSDWNDTGNTWTTSWDYDFSHSVTYTEGEDNGTEAAWNWLEDDAPYAAWPEQVWVDGEALEQAGSLDDVVEGTFYVDGEANLLYLGSDPAGRSVTASTLQQAFQISNQTAPTQRLRLENLTFQNYASSNPQMAAGVFYTANYDMVNVTVRNTATSAVGIYGDDVHLDGVNIENAGLVGISGNKTSGVTIENSVIRDFNTQRFSAAPVSGAIKITTSDHLTIANNTVVNIQEDPRGSGIWCDESCSDVLVDGNTITNVRSSGILMEISDRVTITNNQISDVYVDGIRIGNTSNATVQGNTVTAQHRALTAWQDTREPGESLYFAMDNRSGIEPDDPDWGTFLDDHMDWKVEHLTVVGNTFTTTEAWSEHATVSVLADVENDVTLDGLAALDAFSDNTVNCHGGDAISISQLGSDEPQSYAADWELP